MIHNSRIETSNNFLKCATKNLTEATQPSEIGWVRLVCAAHHLAGVAVGVSCSPDMKESASLINPGLIDQILSTKELALPILYIFRGS